MNDNVGITQIIVESKQVLEDFRNIGNTYKLFEKIESQKISMSGAAARTGEFIKKRIKT